MIAADGLICQAMKDGHTVTTGPASIDPSTGKPHGMRFPILTVRDVIPAAGAAEADGYMIENLDAWSTPIKVEPKWNQGGRAYRGLCAARNMSKRPIVGGDDRPSSTRLR